MAPDGVPNDTLDDNNIIKIAVEDLVSLFALKVSCFLLMNINL